GTQDLLEHRTDRGRVADIRLYDAMAVGAVAAGPGGGAGQLEGLLRRSLGAGIVDGHGPALLRDADGDCAADAARSSCYQGEFSFEPAALRGHLPLLRGVGCKQ